MIHSRLDEALAAIQTVLKGTHAADAESEVVDFKEEAGTVVAGGQRQLIPPNHDPAARALAAEAACLANSQRGGVLIVGVNDKAAGRDAFTGTYLDTLWLRERIHALTQPHLSVDLIQEQQVAGKRIYLIDVAPQLEEIRCDGKLRTRIGRDCQELDGNRARALLEARRRYDWSAEPSGLRLGEAEPEAVALARQFYGTSHQRPSPASTAEFASRLGLLAGSPQEEDPELNRAGALLLCGFEPNTVQIDVQVKRTESVPATVRLEEPAPLLLAYQRIWDQVQQCFPATPTVVGGLRQSVQAVPERAAREAMVNALMHRDYRQVRNRVLVTALGNPSQTLKVRSPGGFPLDVSADRLLTTPSRPRNPVLTGAFRILGLAEGEGIGIDTLYIQMLRDGHPTPEITEDGGDVICRLAGGDRTWGCGASSTVLPASIPTLVRTCGRISPLLSCYTSRCSALPHSLCRPSAPSPRPMRS